MFDATRDRRLLPFLFLVVFFSLGCGGGLPWGLVIRNDSTRDIVVDYGLSKATSQALLAPGARVGMRSSNAFTASIRHYSTTGVTLLAVLESPEDGYPMMPHAIIIEDDRALRVKVRVGEDQWLEVEPALSDVPYQQPTRKPLPFRPYSEWLAELRRRNQLAP